ncbi:MMPL family transporter [Streptomyces liliifuscus]|uniref:MMPL family transporter n=1 Tax=Streptomyces liliifuscus TaxID=2797636 RepID=A0A7T7I0I4_9ACTN|nr:MMPL family transporter [Streptomyces liliifuscus]QQM38784.1 MMPL family transporter [Streptomyces liliifuscus]
MFDRVAELTVRWPRAVLVVASVLVAAMSVVGVGAFGKLVGGGFDDPDSQSTQASRVIDEKFGGEANLVLLVSGGTQRVSDPAVEQDGRQLVDELRKEPELGNIVSYWDTRSDSLLARDGRSAMVLAHVKGDESTREEHAHDIIDGYAGRYEGLTVKAGGGTAVGAELSEQVLKDLLLAEIIAVPVTLLLLLIVFGGVVAALLPLAIGTVAVAGTFAELALLGSVTDVSVFSINLTTALGLGLGIDYALLMISRFREQLALGASVADAVRTTVHTAGRTVVFSAGTVAVALTALLVFPQYFLRSFAYAGVGVVVIAAVGTLFVMPALLMLLGHRINSGRLPWPKADRRRAPFWGRLAGTVMRRPVLTSVPVLAVLLLAAAPLLGVTFGTPDERVLPEDATSRQVSTALRADFEGDDEAAIQVVADGSVNYEAVDAYAGKLSLLDGVVRVEAATGTYEKGNAQAPGPANKALERPDAQRVTVIGTAPPKSDSAQSLVRAVRDVAAPAGAKDVLVGGGDAELLDTKESIASRLPLAGGLVAVTTFVLLFLFTGSIVQPVRALALNIISLAAAIGAMTWMFQDGHLSSVLGFTAQPMDTSMTVLLFCIAFGLSMDYEVFVTSRIKELHDDGESTENAVVHGLGHTGKIVSAAACLLAVGFFAFATAKVSFMQMFGLGSGLAILIDAIAVRGVLLPAAMRLLGRSAWYAPGPLRKFHQRFGISENGPASSHATAGVEPISMKESARNA